MTFLYALVSLRGADPFNKEFYHEFPNARARNAGDGRLQFGWVTDIEQESAPPGLNEDIIQFISEKKNEPDWLLAWRLKAYRHWLTMTDPLKRKKSEQWAMVTYPDIDYQRIVYYAAPKNAGEGPESLDEVDPELLATYEKLGIPSKSKKC